MFQSPPELRAFTYELTQSLWTLSAIGFLYESGLARELLEPRSLAELVGRFAAFPPERIERCLRLMLSAGLVSRDDERYRLTAGAAHFAQPPFDASFHGDLRAHLMQSLAYLNSAREGRAARGWQHTDPSLLQAQGDASGAVAYAFKLNAVNLLGDLAQRLEQPGARLLDVGVGVGSLAIAFCRVFSRLHVVGLDIFDAPLEQARVNVARESLGARIELERVAIEDYRVESAFDVAWLPTFFIHSTALPRAAARVHAALRPGGWVLFPIGASTGSEVQRDMLALVTELWGGPALSVPNAEALLRTSGFVNIRPLPGPPWAPITLAAQR